MKGRYEKLNLANRRADADLEHFPKAHGRLWVDDKRGSGKLVRRLAHDAPPYSGVGASGKPGRFNKPFATTKDEHWTF